MRLSDCLFSLRSSLCTLHLSLPSSTSSSGTLTSTFSSSMWMSSEQDPLCTSPNEESAPLANNAPLTFDKITVFVDSDFAGEPVSRKSTVGLVTQIGNHSVKFGSTLQSLTALSVGGQVGLSLRSKNQDLGISMKVEIESDSSTANSLTDRLAAGQRTKHIDTRYLWIQERVQDGDLSIKKVLTAKNCADVGTKPVSASVPQEDCKFAGLVFY